MEISLSFTASFTFFSCKHISVINQILDCRFFEFQETKKSVVIAANKLYEKGLIILKNAQPTEAKNTEVF